MVMMNRSELVALMEVVVYRARDKRLMEKPSRASGPIGDAPKYEEASAVEEGDTLRAGMLWRISYQSLSDLLRSNMMGPCDSTSSQLCSCISSRVLGCRLDQTLHYME